MTLTEIITQLESCNFQCEAGSLSNNVAFKELKKLAGKDFNYGNEILNWIAAFAIQH